MTLFCVRSAARTDGLWFGASREAARKAEELGGTVDKVQLLKKPTRAIVSEILNLGAEFPSAASGAWFECERVADFSTPP